MSAEKVTGVDNLLSSIPASDGLLDDATAARFVESLKGTVGDEELRQCKTKDEILQLVRRRHAGEKEST